MLRYQSKAAAEAQLCLSSRTNGTHEKETQHQLYPLMQPWQSGPPAAQVKLQVRLFAQQAQAATEAKQFLRTHRTEAPALLSA